jgi:hypothetical protein
MDEGNQSSVSGTYPKIIPVESDALKVQTNVYQERSNPLACSSGGRIPKVGANHKQRVGEIESKANAQSNA